MRSDGISGGPNWFGALDIAAFTALTGLVFVIPFSTALTEIFSAGLILAWAATQFSGEYRAFWRRVPKAVFGLVFAWGAVAVAASAASRFPLESLSACVTKWGAWIAVAMAASGVLVRGERMVRFAWFFIAASFLIFSDAAWQYVFNADLLRGRAIQYGIFPTAGFQHYTHFGCYAMFSFLLGLGIDFKPGLPRWQRAVLFLHHFIAGVAVAVTLSRSAALGAVVGAVLLGLIQERKVFFLGALAAIAAFFTGLPHALLYRWNHFSGTGGGYRWAVWEAAWNMLMDHPWSGVGINQFSRAVVDYFPKGGYAHNSFLQLAAETGFAGLVIFLLFLGAVSIAAVSACRRSAKTGHYGYGFFFAWSGFLAASFFDNFLYNGQLAVLFWTATGFLISSASQPASATAPDRVRVSGLNLEPAGAPS